MAADPPEVVSFSIVAVASNGAVIGLPCSSTPVNNAADCAGFVEEAVATCQHPDSFFVIGQSGRKIRLAALQIHDNSFDLSQGLLEAQFRFIGHGLTSSVSRCRESGFEG